MAVGTGNIALSDVTTEIGLSSTASLQDCVDNYLKSGMNGTYWVSDPNDPDNLKEFRGYNHTITVTGVSLRYNVSSSSSACSAGATTYYVNNGSFSAATAIFTDSGATTLAPTGYYSDGSNHRFWTQATQTLGTAASC